MIPKRALFYWEGGEMSALRWAAIESFRAWNPGWEVHLFTRSEENPVKGNGQLSTIIRSDWERYSELVKCGGVYFDTDIIFLKPVPEEWLAKDLLLPVQGNGMIYGVHVLGAKPGSIFFERVLADCASRMSTQLRLSAQSLGTKLFRGRNLLATAAECGEYATIVEANDLLPYDWTQIEAIWSPGTTRVPSHSIGLHWYGGDLLSKELEPYAFSSSIECPLTRALARMPKCQT